MGSDHQIFRKSDRVRKIASEVTELQNEYAVIRIAESRIDILSEIPEVEYVEKPKRLFFQAAEGRRVSCINAVQDTRLSLYGQGILVAIIDSGIDYANIDFSKCGRKHEDSVSVGSVSESGRWGNSTGWIQHRCGVYERTNR